MTTFVSNHFSLVESSLLALSFYCLSTSCLLMEDGDTSSLFPIGKSAQEKGLSYVPDCYVVPPPQRSNLTPETTNVPVVDLAGLHDPGGRSHIIKDIGSASRGLGFFQVSC